MELKNVTQMNAAYNMRTDASGREHLVIVIKGTYTMPDTGRDLELAEEQLPFIKTDTFSGEPGISSPVYESDFALVKPYCDVMLHGTAYSPGQRPVTNIPVRMIIGSIDKSFNVIGNRKWSKTLMLANSISPDSFTEMPISYNHAFGGMNKSRSDPTKNTSYTPNPAGKGFAVYKEDMEGIDLPNTEEIGNPVLNPCGKYKPMSFGPIGRGWNPRYKWAGTYDDKWLDNVFPFLPSDFDTRYYQAAPIDQQMPYPNGGETVSLQNLTPEGFAQFRLPKLDMPVEFSMRNCEKKYQHAVVDTIYIEPDNKRVTIIWRTSIPLRNNIYEVEQVLVGKMSHAWRQTKDFNREQKPTSHTLTDTKQLEVVDT